MTPEEALQHDWLLSSHSSVVSSSPPSGSVGGSERRSGVVNGGPAGHPRRHGPITQDSTEDENYTLYKVCTNVYHGLHIL